MTVSYNSDVATVTGLGVFWKLLLRWKGSLSKLIWKDLIVYIIVYYILRCVYRYAMTEEQQLLFAGLSKYLRSFSTLIPMAFVLGFYVSVVMDRWWEQYNLIPWPSSLAVYVSALLQGLDERGRLMRRTIMRYVNMSFVLALSMMSPPVKKRFPTLDHVVEAGFMTTNEQKVLENVKVFSLAVYWMPLVWAGSVITRARKEGRISNEAGVQTLLETINKYRGGLGGLINYDLMSIPLVYTQVVTLATYTYFGTRLIGAQYVMHGEDPDLDLYVPWFTLLQYLFYVGWLRVAETLVNPFGEDDDDFELNGTIDRNMLVSYLIVDEMHNEYPELIQDKYWDEIMPELPYTVATECYRQTPQIGSTAGMNIPKSEQKFVRHRRKSVDEMSDSCTEDSDSQIGHEATKGMFKEDNPDLWVSSPVQRNDSTVSFLQNLWQRPKHGSLRLSDSESSLNSGASSCKEGSHQALKKQRSQEDNPVLPGSTSKLMHVPKAVIRKPSGPLTERLETMEEEETVEVNSDKR